jgi:hypothetical protein
MEEVMKRTLMVMVVLGAVLLGTMVAVSAFTSPRMRVNIGFSFYADDQLLPGGEYWFEIRSLAGGTLAGSPIAIRSEDGSVFQYLTARVVGSERKDEGAYLVFNKVGGSYFLRKIQQGSMQGNLPKSHSEKEVKAAYSTAGSDSAAEIVKIAAAR